MLAKITIDIQGIKFTLFRTEIGIHFDKNKLKKNLLRAEKKRFGTYSVNKRTGTPICLILAC